jgi:hypothetical protein
MHCGPKENYMNRFFSVRRAAFALPLFGIVGLVVPLPAAQADPFHASGSYVETSFKNNIAEGTLDGHAAPGGAFVGEFWEKVLNGGDVLVGTATLDFGNGDTLTFDYLLVYDYTRGRYLGVWAIDRGTGVLKRATGGGDIAATPNGGQAHLFWLDGEISLP